MTKTDVYSWRISRAHKVALEHIAREERVSLAQLLDRVTGQWITARTGVGGKPDVSTKWI